MAGSLGLTAHAAPGSQLCAASRSSARRGWTRCTCSAVAEPPPRLARAALSSDGARSMDSSASNGGMFCIWPRFEAMHQTSGFGRAAQAAQPAQRQMSAAIEALAGVFTDGPVSTQDGQTHGTAERWRYQGLRL